MRLVSCAHVRDLDQKAIHNFGVPSTVLMENAGRGAAIRLMKILGQENKKRPILIFSGPGNNGGDGFVIARTLLNHGIECKLFLCCEPSKIRGDALCHFNILKKMSTSIHPCLNKEDLLVHQKSLFNSSAIVDAILGTGLTRDVSGWYVELLEYINRIPSTFKMAIDVPSGMDADTGELRPVCFRADWTTTFAFAKVGLVSITAAPYVGHLEVIEIGIPAPLMNSIKPMAIQLSEKMLRSWWKPRQKQSHKGRYGHILVVAGSRGKAGAALLTSLSALRSGSGLCTLASEESVTSHVEGRVFEIMCESFSLERMETLLVKKDALAIGPGLSTKKSSREWVMNLMQKSSLPIVLDADGLNVLVDDLDVLKKRDSVTILTPHPGEMARLVGCSTREIQSSRMRIAKEFAQSNQVMLVLKGAQTLVVSPEGDVAPNSTGHPGLATAGSGDVLTGMIASFLGQGYSAWQAACLGVYLHGRAAETLLQTKGMSGLIASDILNELPHLLATWDIQGDTNE